MKEQAKVIHVKYAGEQSVVPVGRLALIDRVIYFEYDPKFLALGLEISPFKLPLKAGATPCSDRVFEGLFGVFNDSLPDGWGRLLLDRKLQNLGLTPATLTPLDRLQYVGNRGMGALRYEPEIDGGFPSQNIEDLDVIARECIRVLELDENQYLDELLLMNGSSAGARPKILVRVSPNSKEYSITSKSVIEDNDWMIKFRSSLDPRDIGPIEYAYHLMAREAGLEVPEARLFKSRKDSRYFGVKRFDRKGGKFLHMHTASGLLHAEFRIPSLDYETLIKATLWLTKDPREGEKQFRNAVFNVFAHNRDDHAKNFSFLMNEIGTWRVSPAYDLTFSAGPGGEHSTLVMGEGRKPTVQHLLRLAQVASINQKKALEVIDQVRGAVSNWPSQAKNAHVSKQSRDNIEKVLTALS